MSQFTIVDTTGQPRIVSYGRRGVVIDTGSLGFVYSDVNTDRFYFLRWFGATSSSYLICTGSNLSSICTLNRFTDGTLLASVRDNATDDWAFYRSADGGVTWTIATLSPFPGLGGTDYGTVTIDERNQVYAMVELNQIAYPFISTDSGSTWRRLYQYGASERWVQDNGCCYYNPITKQVLFVGQGGTNNAGTYALYNPYGTTDSSGSISGSWYRSEGGNYYWTPTNWWYNDGYGGDPYPDSIWHDDTGRFHIAWRIDSTNDNIVEESWALGENAPQTGSRITSPSITGAKTQFVAKRDFNGQIHFIYGNDTTHQVWYRLSQSFGGLGYEPSGAWTSSIVINATTDPWCEFITLESCWSGCLDAGTYNIAGLLVSEGYYANGLLYASQDYTQSFIVSGGAPPPTPTAFSTSFERRGGTTGFRIYTQGSGDKIYIRRGCVALS